MSPPDVVNVSALRKRWSGISRQAVHAVIRRPGFPEGTRLEESTEIVWDRSDIEAWETAEREAGRPLPGERPRGPRPRQTTP
jgi:predicted DNA-binding transcriptional regulator AlpA